MNHQQANSNSLSHHQQQNQQMACIKRPQHNAKLASALNSMLASGSLVDVTIYCDDGQVNAHKLVLAASSTYFRSLFTRVTNTFHYPIIVLREMPVNDLKTIIHFIYYGEVSVPQNHVDSLMRCANYLQIDGMASSANSLNALLATSSSLPLLSHTTKASQQYPPGLQNPYSLNSSSNQRTLMELQNGGTKQRQQGGSNRRATPTSRRRRGQDTQDMNSHLSMTAQNNYQINNLSFSRSLGTSDMNDDLRLYGQAGSSSFLSNQSTSSEPKPGRRGDPNKVKFECPTCHKFFTHGFTLKRHMKLHSQRSVVYCDTCSKTYSCRDSFLRHKKSSGHMQQAISIPSID